MPAAHHTVPHDDDHHHIDDDHHLHDDHDHIDDHHHAVHARLQRQDVRR
jgi:hypothetical protein